MKNERHEEALLAQIDGLLAQCCLIFLLMERRPKQYIEICVHAESLVKATNLLVAELETVRFSSRIPAIAADLKNSANNRVATVLAQVRTDFEALEYGIRGNLAPMLRELSDIFTERRGR